ncbi:succinate dehydrogenase assembly factor 2 [Halomonas sp. SSL-5]|uniref:FAD assembly factor SdhE n=1 Tax=Halomonas sp. SSL-5 TaxID=3065855 RepID=UPI0027397C09|nr:succinate dehydrogenase assembly factor 2 [Halomonas sp. SSL-5]MDY7115126.1 succinate dehydrogenase assembly factor 2 [Halomonas sp. SSL-5]
MNEPSSPEAAQRKRLYWHSRRGMWELDLLLVPFLEQRYDALEPADQAAFRDLIDEEDQDLFMWLMRRELPAEPQRRRIVQMIIEHAESADSVSHRPV